ncbi:hypothetical protein GCM10008014_40100 [Paenibacillus silvae]|uniref:Uncharacterized protein n=1 Tax=Paenibacillus silvae TaxID=1325358 RepID=A0A2W6PF17_9BACL|nr:hypothetical protein DN757_05440 [Paenibacillus silvae]GGH63044.1 hypothetical protein GCM10008014_40100 [Paenibacillus silvae]
MQMNTPKPLSNESRKRYLGDITQFYFLTNRGKLILANQYKNRRSTRVFSEIRFLGIVTIPENPISLK